jgi:hypothetical protein
MKHCTESLHRLLIDDQIAKLKEQTMGTKQWGHQTMTKQWGQIYLSHHEPVNSPTIAQYKNKSVPFISNNKPRHISLPCQTGLGQ